MKGVKMWRLEYLWAKHNRIHDETKKKTRTARVKTANNSKIKELQDMLDQAKMQLELVASINVMTQSSLEVETIADIASTDARIWLELFNEGNEV